MRPHPFDSIASPRHCVTHRVTATHAALALVILLGSLISVIALRSASQRSAQMRSANAHLAALDELRAAAGELERTVRRYSLTGHRNEQLRGHAIASELEQLAPRVRAHDPSGLLADVRRYNSSLTELLAYDEPELAARLDLVERELELAYRALDDRFALVAARARAERDVAPTVEAVTQRALWSVAGATALALFLSSLLARSRHPR